MECVNINYYIIIIIYILMQKGAGATHLPLVTLHRKKRG